MNRYALLNPDGQDQTLTFVVEVVPENRSGVSECDPRVGIAQA